MEMVKHEVAVVRAFIGRAATFFDKHDQAEQSEREHQEERHKENSEKLDLINSKISQRSLVWTIAGVLIAAAALAVGILSIIAAVKLAHADLRQIVHPFRTIIPTLSA